MFVVQDPVRRGKVAKLGDLAILVRFFSLLLKQTHGSLQSGVGHVRPRGMVATYAARQGARQTAVKPLPWRHSRSIKNLFRELTMVPA